MLKFSSCKILVTNITALLRKKLRSIFTTHPCCHSINQSCLFVIPWTAAHQASLSFTIHQSLLKLMSNESVMPSNHLILCCPLLLLPSMFPIVNVFSNKLTLTSGSQSMGASASASVLPMNIKDWSPLGLTDLIFLQSKELSGVFSKITIQKHHFSVISLLNVPTLTSIHDYWKNHSFNYVDLCSQSDVSAF